MKILGNNLSESPVGKLYSTVKRILTNSYMNENQENINSPNSNCNIESLMNESSEAKDSKGDTKEKSPILRRRANEVRKPKHLISNIPYNSDSSDDSEILPPRRSVRLKTSSTPTKRKVRKMSSSDEEARDSGTTVKFDEKEAATLYSKINHSDNEVTTSSSSSSKSSSSAEEIDISIPDHVVVRKKKKSKRKTSSFSDTVVTETSESNDFFSVEGEIQEKTENVESDVVVDDSEELKSDNDNQEKLSEVQGNNDEKIEESDVEMNELSSNQNLGKNVTLNEYVEVKQNNKRGSCCAALRRKKKSERLMKKRKELTPCVIIDIIRRKTHPLNRYQHLFTHKTLAKLTDKEFTFLKRIIMKHHRKNVKK